MSRGEWEAKAALGRLGFRSMAELDRERRRARLAVYAGEERRLELRRANDRRKADNARVADWLARFDAARV